MLADVALVGFGNVARRFVRLLAERQDALLRDYDLEVRIVGIATLRHGAIQDAGGVDAIRAAAIVEGGGSLTELTVHPSTTRAPSSEGVIDALALSAAPLRTVIETTTLDIAAGQPAIAHVRRALEHGCHAVTANKGPAAFAYRDLARLAAQRRVSFLFEGAVMDGIPVFNFVRDTLPAVSIEGFRGVVNSTTNHILTVLEDGEEFAAALAHMQAEGIAEADPSLDVQGWDAAAKAAALANVFLDAGITPHDVSRGGVDPSTAAAARAAKARGNRLRLVAAAERGMRPSVKLVELPPDDLLAGLRGTANALILQTDTVGRIAITQLDGGLTHTAYALLSDLLAVRRRARLS